MKKIILLLLLSQLLNGCLLMPLGAPHSHSAKNLTDPKSELKLNISCLPHHKYYGVSGTESSDRIYISSIKMIEPNSLMKDKSYCLKIGDFNFHRKAFKDTVTIKIVKSDATIKLYSFLVQKDD